MIRSLLDRVVAVGRRLRRPLPPRTRRILLGVAAAGFVVGGWLAFDALDVELGRISWPPLLLAGVVGVPFSAAVSAAEYYVSGRILGHRIGARQALVVTVMGTAANLLPVPGSAMVRVGGLRQEGSGYGVATSVTVAVGIVWIGVSSLLAGVWLIAAGRLVPVAAFGLGGLAVLAVAPPLLRRARPPDGRVARWTAIVVAVELASVASSVLRLVLVLDALPGTEASITAAVVLSVSTSFASAAGIFPGGLGLREALSAAFAPIVGLSAAAGFLVSAVNRLVGVVVYAPISVMLLVTQRRRPAADSRSVAGGEGSSPS